MIRLVGWALARVVEAVILWPLGVLDDIHMALEDGSAVEGGDD